jgi:hypothetical protein
VLGDDPGPGAGGGALGDELGPDHRHVAGRVDPEADLPPLQADDGHADVVADEELFHQLAGQHQHRRFLSGPGSVLSLILTRFRVGELEPSNGL